MPVLGIKILSAYLVLSDPCNLATKAVLIHQPLHDIN